MFLLFSDLHSVVDICEVLMLMGCKHTNKEARSRADGYWQLVAAGEPFRLLFPIGTALGCFGVLLWPLHVWMFPEAYPGTLHARIMIQGFLTSFVIGFLGTALPRLLGAPRITLGETLGFAGALVGIVILHAAGLEFWGNQLFIVTLCALLFVMGVRAVVRKDVPPPAFVLVGLGILSALAGACIYVFVQVAPLAAPDWLVPLGRLLMNQAFLLLPIMGVGAFLLPRFFGLPNRQSFPETNTLPPGWRSRALFALACGMGVMGSFLLQTAGLDRWGYGLRACVVLVYLLREVPFLKAGPGGGSLALGARVALLSIPLGYAAMALWPTRSFSLLHVVFITGFGLLTFIVASRVTLGHSGQAEKFNARLWPITTLVLLMILAMATRVSADWMPALRLSHYAYAALVWICGVGIWAFKILPGIRKTDES